MLLEILRMKLPQIIVEVVLFAEPKNRSTEENCIDLLA
jgi:hypothetical protein